MTQREKVVSTAKRYIGCKESNGSHKKIIDRYNSHKPLARGYAVKYTDEWCATFVSAVSIECGLTNIMPTECSCTRMVDLYKKLGCWKETDSYIPSPGDIIMYDWQDSGVGDNASQPDHVGIVEKVVGNTITVIEGNKSEAVARRTLTVNGKYIRGYCLPAYDKKATAAPQTTQTAKIAVSVSTLRFGATGGSVRALQAILTAKGCDAKGIDGDFGVNTEQAVKTFQRANGLEADGIVGKNTWTALLS